MKNTSEAINNQKLYLLISFNGRGPVCIKPFRNAFKEIVHPKMKVPSVITHPHVVPAP